MEKDIVSETCFCDLNIFQFLWSLWHHIFFKWDIILRFTPLIWTGDHDQLLDLYGGISCLEKKNSIYIWCWPLKLRDKWWSFNETSASLGFKSRAPFNLYFSTTRPTFTQLLHTFGCGWYTTFTQLLHTRLLPDNPGNIWTQL